MSPMETTCEKPMPRACAQSMIAGHQRARLRQEREIALARHAMREAGVDADARQDQAEAVRPDDAQAMGLRRLQHAGADRRRGRR